MTAVADVATGTVHATIDIRVPPERVFEALTTPGQLAAWWGSPELYRTHGWQVDLRVGGQWSCLAEGPKGEKTTVRGTYLELKRPDLIVTTWYPSWDPLETTIRYELKATPAGTQVKVTHTGFGAHAESCKGHANGWNRVFGWLTAYVEAQAVPR